MSFDGRLQRLCEDCRHYDGQAQYLGVEVSECLKLKMPVRRDDLACAEDGAPYRGELLCL